MVNLKEIFATKNSFGFPPNINNIKQTDSLSIVKYQCFVDYFNSGMKNVKKSKFCYTQC